MTFLELERRCKIRRVFKILKLVFLFIIILAIYIFLNKNNLLLFENQKLLKNSVKEKKENKINKKDDKILELKFEVNFQELYRSYESNFNNKQQSKLKQEDKVVKKTIKKDGVKEQKIIKSKSLPPYETCIKLAKEYYKKGDYKQALKWAKNANIQDNKKASAWIITAKALYKMGKKDEAIKILKIYYSYTQDEKIKELINNMK